MSDISKVEELVETAEFTFADNFIKGEKFPSK